MRNPYAVSLHLLSYQRIDDKGKAQPLYSSEQIEEILAKNFGKDWRKN